MRIGLGLALALACGAIMSLAGCGGSGNGTNLPDPFIQFLNSSPDANPLDYYINTDQKATAMTYLSPLVSTSTTNGDKDIIVKDSTTQTELDAVAFSFVRDRDYLAFAAGLENYGTETDKRLRLVAFQYDKNPPNGSKARLLVEHAFMRSTGFQTPDIDFQGGPSATYDPNNPLFKAAGVQFGAAQPSVLEVDAGVSTIVQARRADTENVYASSTDTFDAGGIYLALVTGIEGAIGAQAPQIKYFKLN